MFNPRPVVQSLPIGHGRACIVIDDALLAPERLPAFADGYYTTGDRPGLGVEVDEARLRQRPYRPFFFPVIRREDGSIQDP